MEILLVKNKDLDKKRWDECLLSIPGSELYMQSSYLDKVSPGWKGLVAGNYDAIFPIFEETLLIWKLNRQPLFTGAWTVKGTNPASVEALQNYLSDFLTQYTWLDLYLNTSFAHNITDTQKEQKKYQKLRVPEQGFTPSKELRKNIQKATKAGMSQIENVSPFDFLNGISENLLTGQKVLSKSGMSKLKTLLEQSSSFKGECLGVYNYDQTLGAAQFFLKGPQRLFFILCFTTAEGRSVSALHFLQSKIIEQYLPAGGYLHFGGSNIPRIAAFNHNFGAEDISALRIFQKKLPFLL